MPFGTGLDSTLGMAEEASYGTYIAPTTFFEFNSAGIEPQVQKLYSMPLGTGRLQQTSRRRTFITGAGGDFEVDAVNRGIGLLLKHMFGSVASAQVATTPEYTHTFTLHPEGKRGLSATVQVGTPTTDSGVQPFNYVGGKIVSWQMSAAMDEILKITPTWDFKTVSNAEPLAAPSYTTDPEPFTFLDGTLTIGGTGIGTVKGVTLTWEEALATDRRSFGNQKFEPLANGELAITGEFESEFTDRTAYDAWVNGTELVDLIITFTGSNIPTLAVPYQLILTVPSLEYTGSAPTIDGPEVIQQTLPFKALYNGTAEILTAELHNDEVAV